MNKKIKIVYILNDLLTGGAQRVVLDLVSVIDRDQFDVEVWSLMNFKKDTPALADLEKSFAQAVPVLYISDGGRFGFKHFIKLHKLLKKTKPDIVHCHLPFAVIVGTAAAVLARVRIRIAHEHNTYKLNPAKVTILRTLLRPFITVTLCYSELVEKEMFGTEHLLKGDITIIDRRSYTVYNPIDTHKIEKACIASNRSEKRKALGAGLSDTLIVSTGRLIPWKGHVFLIRAFALIAKKFPEAKLLIIGWGPQEETLRAIIQTNALENKVFLLGARSDVYEILAASDIFSYVAALDTNIETESIGVAGFEAMAFGLPVVVADYLAAKKFINNGVNGMTVRAKDEAAIAQALGFLIENPKERQQMGEKAKDFIEQQLSWDIWIKVYQNFYKTLMAI